MPAPMIMASMILPAHAAYSVADLLEGLDEPQALSTAAFEIPGTQDFIVQAMYAQDAATENLHRSIAPLIEALEIAMPRIKIEALEDRDWIAHSLADLPPIHAGRFFIAGAHGLGQAPRGAIRLHVEAGQAFGTGHHETTHGCLLALGWLARRRRFRYVLDLGCGTGVLGMAAAKLWRRRVIASDIDPIAIVVTRENAHRNGLAACMRPVVAAGFAHPELSSGPAYDLVLANILARPLMRLSNPMARRVRAGGYVILSGLLRSQEAAVRSAYRTQGLFLERRFLRNEWSTLLLRKAKIR
ncbi:MAG: ribosomal protein L11 methyltransferase [Alphaproteobacteria bacterium]|nr:ribosomal protein L11 methyltransferase [Alphaproteobacteria bacterium]